MSQTHAQHRNLAVEVADRLHGDAGIFRVSRSRREDQCLRVQNFDLLNGDLVVADYLNVTVQFTDILIQIIGERIIVINQQDHCSASLMALMTANALLTVS